MVKVNRTEDQAVAAVGIPQINNNAPVLSNLVYLHSGEYFLAEGVITNTQFSYEVKGWLLVSLPTDADKKKLNKDDKKSLTIPYTSVKYIQHLNYKSK